MLGVACPKVVVSCVLPFIMLVSTLLYLFEYFSRYPLAVILGCLVDDHTLGVSRAILHRLWLKSIFDIVLSLLRIIDDSHCIWNLIVFKPSVTHVKRRYIVTEFFLQRNSLYFCPAVLKSFLRLILLISLKDSWNLPHVHLENTE